jgi:flagella basal body P-ring formation protein FlgA
MRTEVCVLSMLLVPAAVPAATDARPELTWTARIDSADALRDELLQRASAHLASVGLHLVRNGARVTTSRPVEFGREMQIRLHEAVAGGTPVMPLVFDLRPSGPTRRFERASVTAWLSAPVQREVRVARRSLRRGDSVDCDDTEVVMRDIERIPDQALGPRCQAGAEDVAARDLGKGDLLRAKDVGPAPMVAAQADVRLLVKIGNVVVERSGRALSSAAHREAVWVRVDGTSRTVRGSAIARNVVEVTEDHP